MVGPGLRVIIKIKMNILLRAVGRIFLVPGKTLSNNLAYFVILFSVIFLAALKPSFNFELSGSFLKQ